MGLCASNEDVKQNDEINKELKADRKADKLIFKTLLLGTGGSGKSTIFKQMIKLQGKGLSPEHLISFHMPMKRNCLQGIISLVKQSRLFMESKFDEDCGIAEENEDSAEYVLQFDENLNGGLVAETAEHLQKLWNDNGIKNTFQHRARFQHQIFDNVDFFLDKVLEVYNDDYVVSEEDAFKARVITTGMNEERFSMGPAVGMHLVDVGGQRSERRKWIKWFDNVQCVMFVVAVSEFDQLLYEDGKTSRFEESMKVWEEIVNLEQFYNCRFMLFLNKTDLLREKIQHTNISDYVEEYKGEEGNYTEALKFFKETYLSAAGNRNVGVYATTATDSTIMKTVLDNVRGKIIDDALGAGGMM